MHRIKEKAKHRETSIDKLKSLLQQGRDKLKLIDLVFSEIDKTNLDALKYAIKFVEKLHPSTAYYNPYEYVSSVLYVSHGEKLDVLKVQDDLRRYRQYAIDDIAKLDYELKYQMIFADLIREKMIYVSRGFSTDQKDTVDHKDDLIKALRSVPFMKGFDVTASSSSVQAHSHRLFSAEPPTYGQLQLVHSKKTAALVASASSFTPAEQANKLSPR